MIKTFLKNNVVYFDDDFNFIIEQLNEKTMQIFINYNKRDYVEKINNIDVILYYDENAYENNIYLQFNISFENRFLHYEMHECVYFMIDCDCDICDINDNIIFERYIDLLIKTKSYVLCKIENINFNLIK